ncbi:MAG: SDR family NAD(P)-dependent oxidoreductase, partial [Gammaproteobacteria bacterium]|nr:SDR family NAD(P)-dependent oxidoreductase [Gammaproteobacteria bacterium]
RWLSTLHRGRDEWEGTLRCLASLYQLGVSINWQAFDSPYTRRKIALPTYPFQRKKFWPKQFDNIRHGKENLYKEMPPKYYTIKWSERAAQKFDAERDDAISIQPNKHRLVFFVGNSESDETRTLRNYFSQSAGCSTFVYPGNRFSDVSSSHYTIDFQSLPDYENLFDEVSRKNTSEQSSLEIIIYFTPIQSLKVNSTRQSVTKITEDVSNLLLTLVQALSECALSHVAKLFVITTNIVATSRFERPNLYHSPLSGLCQVIYNEFPHFKGKFIDVDVLSDKIINNEIHDGDDETFVAYRKETRFIRRLVDLSEKSEARDDSSRILPNTMGSYLITGGLGDVGMASAEWLANSKVKQIILVSRSEASKKALSRISKLASAETKIDIVNADISDEKQLDLLFEKIKKYKYPLLGIIHAAGVLSDATIKSQNRDKFRAVYAAKVDGTWNLHYASRKLPLDFFLLYSSISSIFGPPGQANYSAANSFLDVFSHYRRYNNLPATVINWPPVNNTGMASHIDKSKNNIYTKFVQPIEKAKLPDYLNKILGSSEPQISVISFNDQAIRSHLGSPLIPRVLETLYPNMLLAPTLAIEETQPRMDERLCRVSPEEQRQIIFNVVKEKVCSALQLDTSEFMFRPDQPLIELGLDSLTAVEIRNSLARQLGKSLPVSLLYDYPTIQALTEFILSDSEQPLLKVPEQEARSNAQNEPIAVIGIACHFPGKSNNTDDFWQLLMGGKDGVVELGNKRWDMQRFYSEDMNEQGKMYVKWGGIIEDIEKFDADFFDISPREAINMDPQQRLLLQTSWETIEHAGIDPTSLTNARGGIFVGVGPNEYGQLQAESRDRNTIDSFSATGNSLSVNAGRLSYVLGWNGPSMAIDTACSSSLVAIHLAVQSLKNNECEFALAGGVNLTLSPEVNISLSKAKMLSQDGRCKTFDETANGYIRSEGCGLVLLKPLSKAIRDHDNILATIKSSAVNHDGRSQGLTAPNGPAQVSVIKQALQNGHISPSEIDYVEAHGTGTSLGDPIEINALSQVFGERNNETKLLLGAVKSNIGHLEAAAGVAGFIKTVLTLQHEVIPPNLHLQTISPRIAPLLHGMRVAVTSNPWPRDKNRRRLAGVSSFGFSGTNAHVILEEAPQTAALTSEVER